MNKLTIINDALISTGNSTLNIEFDGSDLWIAAESAFRRAVGYLLSRHRWNFATTTVPLAGRVPQSPHPRLANAYALPPDCLHVVGAYINNAPLTVYELLDDKLCCGMDQGVSIKYVRTPEFDAWPPIFVELVTMKIEEYILRGLNEDDGAADSRYRAAEAALQEARTLSDQQEPARAMFRSRSAARRSGAARRTRFDRFPYDGVP